MELELLNLLNDYSKKGIYGNDKFVMQIANILLRYYQKQYIYFSGVQVINSENSIFGNAKAYIGKIEIDIDFIKNYMFDVYKGFNNDKLNAYFININIMNTMIHEFNHIIQYKKFLFKLYDNNLLDKLFVNSFGIMTTGKFTELNNTKPVELSKTMYVNENYYSCFVHERLAEIAANDLVSKIILPIKSEIEQLYYWFLNYSLSFKMDHYIENDTLRCPVDMFLKQFEISDNFWKSENCYDEDYNLFLKKMCDKFPFKIRLNYGLPITAEEYNGCVDIINETNSLCGDKGYVMNKIKSLKK